MSKRIWLELAMICLLLAGCGATTKTADSATPTATAPQPTATPSPLPTASASQLAACGMTGATGVSRVGDLLVEGPSLGNLAYPSRKLPDNTPLKPLHLAGVTGGLLEAQLPFNPPTNPGMEGESGGGYALEICNSSSSQTHVLRGVSARIDGITQYSGQLNAWNLCAGSYYDASNQGGAIGCGGGFCADEVMKATFAPEATSGATVETVQVKSDKDGGIACGDLLLGPLPVSLKPHKGSFIDIGIAIPSAPATYTFAFGVALDTADTVFLPATRPVLLAPVVHKWTGAACMMPAMQSQIPPAISPTYYICPEA